MDDPIMEEEFEIGWQSDPQNGIIIGGVVGPKYVWVLYS